MKILLVTTISDTINAFLIPHIEMLVNGGHRVEIAFNIHSEIDHKIINLGCKIHRIEFKRSVYDKKNLIAFKQIRKVIKEEKYHLIHTHTPIASFLTRLACLTIRGHDINIIYTAHGFHFFRQAPFINWLLYYPVEKFLSRYTKIIVTINREDYQIARKKFKRGSTRFINGVGVCLDKFSPSNQTEKIRLRGKYGYNVNDYILVYAAELNYTKHQDLLISAINLLKNNIPEIRLLLAGTGNLSETYQKQVRQLCIDAHVHFLGYRKNISELLTISDVAVSSSRREGLPVNLMEAMATGLPIIATNCRGNRDLITNGYNGILVDGNNIQQMADAIQRLYLNKDLLIQFGKKNLSLINRYSTQTILKEMKKIYESAGLS